MPGSRLLAYALLALGALWLLVEVGFVPPSLTLALLNWWPLLLVALGLDLILPARRRGPLPLTLIAAAVILLVGLFGLAGTEFRRAASFQEPLPPGARSLTARLELGNARTTIGPAAAGLAVDATFDGVLPGAVTLEGAEELTFTLHRPSGRWYQFGRSTWEVGLTPELPLALTLRAGAGGAALDLTGFDLARLDVAGGSGALDLRLPGGGRYYQAELGGGSGRLQVSVAAGASLDLLAETGSGGMRLAVGERTDLQLILATGSGPVDIDLPDDAPIRLEVQDDGSGRLRLPPFLTRRSGSGDTGVWQSAAYEQGGRVIHLTVVAAGSGSITLR